MTDALDVTVVIPAYNRGDCVERAVNSALHQRPSPPSEVIVVDDASVDDTVQRAEAAGARVIRLATNGRAGNARNIGAREAQTRWLTFLDSDDLLLPEALGSLYPHAGPYSVVAGVSLIRELGRPDRVHGTAAIVPEVIDDPRRVIFPGNPFPASGGLISKDALLDVGGYSTTLRYGEDFDLWIRLVERQPALLVNVPVVIYNRHAGGKSQDASALRARIAIVEAYRDRQWWSRDLSERYAAALYWLTARDLARSSDRWGALRLLTFALRTPTRARAVACVAAHNLALRRRRLS